MKCAHKTDTLKCRQFFFFLIITPILSTDEAALRWYRTKWEEHQLKYILLWSFKPVTRTNAYSLFKYFGNGQSAFYDYACPVKNCFVTNDSSYFDGNLTEFDAILFDGMKMPKPKMPKLKKEDLPQQRLPSQKYVFVNKESSDNYPVCDKAFDGFFNWTATYKLSSDIHLLHFLIMGRDAQLLGPKPNMKWVQNNMYDNNLNASSISFEGLQSKTKAVAWFVSNCHTRNNRHNFVEELQAELNQYNLTVDIYGRCGPLKCPFFKREECFDMLEKDYFFYLALENSISEDYVTEKVLNAMNHNVVPIVNGLNYNNFLPPGSYIHIQDQNVSELAKKINVLMHSPHLYRQYFTWKHHYIYCSRRGSEVFEVFSEGVCKLCEMLNTQTNQFDKYYGDFRKWWNPAFEKRCKV